MRRCTTRAADLYVYFYHRGCELLRRGGRLAYIVSNKWLRAGYGEPLRRYLAEQTVVERIVDFGHAPIFPDADTFPCIAVLRKPDAEPAAPAETEVCAFPREELGRSRSDRPTWPPQPSRAGQPLQRGAVEPGAAGSGCADGEDATRRCAAC